MNDLHKLHQAAEPVVSSMASNGRKIKFCKKCLCETERYVSSKRAFGLCMPCAKTSASAWQTANPERHKENYKAWSSANPEKIRAKNAALRAANPERHKAYSAARYAANTDRLRAVGSAWYAANKARSKLVSSAWYEANREKVRLVNAAWRVANPEACRIFTQNRRARKRENGGHLSKGLTAKLLKLQKGKCPCCKKPLGDDFHLDHIIPLALGGSNTDDNIQLLRQRCNGQKRAAHPIDFMQSRGFLL